MGPLAQAFLANRLAISAFLRARGGANADPGYIEDLMQELWLRASAVTSEAVCEPLAYLFRMAHNLVLERGRAQARSRRRDADWIHATNSGPAAVEEAVAERALLARENLKRVEDAILGVGERAARVFRRYRIDGIHQRDIASELSISLSTVEKDLARVYAALETLKREMNEE